MYNLYFRHNGYTCIGLNTRHKLLMRLFGNYGDKQSHNLKLSKLLYILVLATLIMYMMATKNSNNTLVHRVCENEFVRYYLFSLSFESPRYQQ